MVTRLAKRKRLSIVDSGNQGLESCAGIKDHHFSAVFGNHVVPDPVLLEIAKNNPSLEYVSRNVEGFPPNLVKDEGLVFRYMLAVNSRLTRIKSFYGAPSCPCCRRRLNAEVSHRPSYGVPSRLSDKSTLRHALSTIKIATDPEDYETVPVVVYSYNLGEQ